MSAIQCNGCTACCKRDVIVLRDGDDHDALRWHWVDGIEAGLRALDRKPNAECVYLGPHGCTIHERKPATCRAFDCRVLFLTTPKQQRRIRITQNPTLAQVYEAGKKRLGTLEVTP